MDAKDEIEATNRNNHHHLPRTQCWRQTYQAICFTRHCLPIFKSASSWQFRLACLWGGLSGSNISLLWCRAAHWNDDGDKYTKAALISPEIRMEWKMFQSYLSKQSKGTLYSQLSELNTNDMLRTMFLNINTLANIYLYLSALLLLKRASHKWS